MLLYSLLDVCQVSIKHSAALVRFAEIGIKSKQTRRRMTNMLVENIRSALDEMRVNYSTIRNEYSRIIIDTDEGESAAKIAAKVFGVASTSPVVITSSDFADILNTGEQLARANFRKGFTFAVGARRVGNHDYSSQEIRAKLGERLLEGNPDLSLTVSLKDPQQSIYVEVRNDISYIFTDTFTGVGGMPTGSQGKVVCTVSTGLDSPIAAYKIMKRGALPIFVYYDNSPHCDAGCTEIAIKQAQLLANYIYNHQVKMYIVPHWPDLEDAIRHGPEKMTCLFCKRNMMRIAHEIAIREGADAIVTGEIIGEQASQTTANLKVIDNAVLDIPILRPNIGDDKVDIMRIAREIGTYTFSEEGLKCCDLAPKHPAVVSTVQKAADAEETMDYSILLSELDNAQVLVLREKS
jgi:thiamine biosynthesis protein ThiI